MQYSIITLISFFLLGCDETLFDCILIPNNSELQKKELLVASLHSPYMDEIAIEVANVSSSDYLISSYNITGELPDGVGIHPIQGIGCNYFLLTGQPRQSGLFNFELHVIIEPYPNPSAFDDDEGTICNDSLSQTYQIEVR